MTATTGSLRLRILGAVRWVIVGSAGMHLVRFVGNLVVTRLLAPEMFGLMAIATTVSVIIAMLSDVGLRPATIRSARGSDPAFLDTVWALQIIRGILLWLVAIAVALALAFANHRGWVRSDSTYANPSLPALIIAAGFSSVIIGLASTLSLSAIRRFDTKLPLKLDLVSTIVGILTMIAVAKWSHSVWSLVIGTYASTVCGVVLSHWFMPKPRHRFRLESEALVEILSIGKWLALSSAITVFASNGDRLLLGAFADPKSLGHYAIAFSLVGALSLVLGQVMESVLLPAFCEIARTDPTRLPGPISACAVASIR
jgi:O-antigen/teichoic acid export membrane protein